MKSGITAVASILCAAATTHAGIDDQISVRDLIAPKGRASLVQMKLTRDSPTDLLAYIKNIDRAVYASAANAHLPAPPNLGHTGPKLVAMATIICTSASDNLNDTSLADRIVGHGGNDILIGFDGDDVLEGGKGADLRSRLSTMRRPSAPPLGGKTT
jgi:RTX calcium-binding nonapeptide repeat (4 copies)